MLGIDERRFIGENNLNPAISDYAFTTPNPYSQYGEALGIADFFDAVSLEMKEHLLEYLNNFAYYTNFAGQQLNDFTQTYTSFYLLNYFGLKKLPNPTNMSSVTATLFDSGEIYDSNKIWDELISGDAQISAHLNSLEWGALASVRLDRSYEVMNLDYIVSILKKFYAANTRGAEFDPNTLTISASYAGAPAGTLITIILPRDADGEINNEEIWNRFILMANFDADAMGLPAGVINFVLAQ